MDTSTGRIYDPDEYSRRLAAMDAGESFDAHQGDFEAAMAAGRIVPVSEDVARQVRTGQRVEELRRKRKAAKAARKSNRGR